MKDELISFETAKLAKEKGFTVKDNYLYKWYNGLGNLHQWMYLKTDEEVEFIAPTQSLLQKWLREKHGIHVFITCFQSENKTIWQVFSYYLKDTYPIALLKRFKGNVTDTTLELDRKKFKRSVRYNTYEEALEEGLQEALKLIEL